MIDPAILRPGRIDRKIKVTRPTKEGSGEIYRIYLTPNLPVRSRAGPGRRRRPAGHRCARPTRSSTRSSASATKTDSSRSRCAAASATYLYRGDLISGAIIAGIVERAKGIAIKRAIASRAGGGHLPRPTSRVSLEAEYAQNDIFPPTDITEDWLKLIDYDPENVVKVSPVRPGAAEAQPRSII